MKRALVFGGAGQLGRDVCETFARQGFDIQAPDHQTCEISDLDAVMEFTRHYRPEIVINAAAMHNLPTCELDPVGARTVNEVGARAVALAATEVGAYTVYISSDYVFDGQKAAPYVESDVPSPLNEYGRSKRMGELAVLGESPHAAVLRVAAIYGHSPCRGKGGLNFVDRMLAAAQEMTPLRVVNDEITTPTSTVAVARQLSVLSEERPTGVIHGTCEGQCSWFEFAKAIFAYSGIDHPVQSASTSDFPASVARPKYSTLQNQVLSAGGINVMPQWRDALRDYLAA